MITVEMKTAKPGTPITEQEFEIVPGTDWKNFSKLSEREYHRHLSYS